MLALEVLALDQICDNRTKIEENVAEHKVLMSRWYLCQTIKDMIYSPPDLVIYSAGANTFGLHSIIGCLFGHHISSC